MKRTNYITPALIIVSTLMFACTLSVRAKQSQKLKQMYFESYTNFSDFSLPIKKLSQSIEKRKDITLFRLSTGQNSSMGVVWYDVLYNRQQHTLRYSHKLILKNENDPELARQDIENHYYVFTGIKDRTFFRLAKMNKSGLVHPEVMLEQLQKLGYKRRTLKSLKYIHVIRQ